MWVGYVVGAATTLVFLVKGKRGRVVDPDRTDPARNFWMLKAALIALLVGLVFWFGTSSSSSSSSAEILVVTVAAIVYLAGVTLIRLGAATLRRATGYVICEDTYRSAPRAIKTSMRKIYKASAAIESTRAYRDGMFGDLDVGRLTFSAAQRAMLSSDLAASTAESAGADSATRIEDMQASKLRQQTLLDEVREVERSLGRAAMAANKLSHDLDEPNRMKAAQLASMVRQQHKDDMKSRLDAVNARIDSVAALDTHCVEDRIISVQAGYAEAREITNRATGTPAKPHGPNGKHRSQDASGHVVKTVLKSATRGTGRLARVAAVRLGKSSQ